MKVKPLNQTLSKTQNSEVSPKEAELITKTSQSNSSAGFTIPLSGKDHRFSLMSKLALNHMINPGSKKEEYHQTVIIFDWDDTLMSSTFLAPFQSMIMQENVRKKLPKQVLAQLDTLEIQVTKLLTQSLANGYTYIITNAGTGWVELSSMRFMPKLYKDLIKQSKINGLKIISARSKFEKEFPSKIIQKCLHFFSKLDGFKEWKSKTFIQLIKDMDEGKIANIIAIGDN